MPDPHPIVLYDGVCGLCNRLVQFILKRDRNDRFRFAALQSDFGRRILLRHGRDPEILDTVYLVLDHTEPTERVLTRNDAVATVLEQLGGFWRVAATLFRLFPRSVRDRQYNLIARNRYQIFGKYDACPLPDPKLRHRFID